MRFSRLVSNMLNRLHGQPDSYDKKCGLLVFPLAHLSVQLTPAH